MGSQEGVSVRVAVGDLLGAFEGSSVGETVEEASGELVDESEGNLFGESLGTNDGEVEGDTVRCFVAFEVGLVLEK